MNVPSNTMQKRLKSLRENYRDTAKGKKGISHQRLSELIMEKYGISISKSSLINYESTNSKKENAKNGMRTEYLICFSDLYGVSTDYILGINDVKNCDTSCPINRLRKEKEAIAELFRPYDILVAELEKVGIKASNRAMNTIFRAILFSEKDDDIKTFRPLSDYSIGERKKRAEDKILDISINDNNVGEKTMEEIKVIQDYIRRKRIEFYSADELKEGMNK